MKSGLLIIVLAIVFICSATSHAVEKKCEFCHAGHNGTGGLLKSDINELCLDCHQERAAKGEHKVGMVPSMPVNGMPLSDGKITCATCHNPHSKAKFMLRKPADQICRECHKM